MIRELEERIKKQCEVVGLNETQLKRLLLISAIAQLERGELHFTNTDKEENVKTQEHEA